LVAVICAVPTPTIVTTPLVGSTVATDRFPLAKVTAPVPGLALTPFVKAAVPNGTLTGPGFRKAIVCTAGETFTV
jgi:hypothetical protein